MIYRMYPLRQNRRPPSPKRRKRPSHFFIGNRRFADRRSGLIILAPHFHLSGFAQLNPLAAGTSGPSTAVAGKRTVPSSQRRPAAMKQYSPTHVRKTMVGIAPIVVTLADQRSAYSIASAFTSERGVVTW